jgi:hypothetical protein
LLWGVDKHIMVWHHCIALWGGKEERRNNVDMRQEPQSQDISSSIVLSDSFEAFYDVAWGARFVPSQEAYSSMLLRWYWEEECAERLNFIVKRYERRYGSPWPRFNQPKQEVPSGKPNDTPKQPKQFIQPKIRLGV